VYHVVASEEKPAKRSVVMAICGDQIQVESVVSAKIGHPNLHPVCRDIFHQSGNRYPNTYVVEGDKWMVKERTA